MINKTDHLKSIRDEVVACKKCELHKDRKYPVVGMGNHDAKVMFIVDAPKENDEKLARPFAGKEGQALDRFLAHIGMKREEVYVSYIIKCRPAGDRDATEEETKSCLSYLTRQLEVVQPKIIVCLGRTAALTMIPLFGCDQGILGPMNLMHGRFYEPSKEFKDMTMLFDQTPLAETKLFVTYHPGSILHNAENTQVLLDDFTLIKEELDKEL